MRPKALERDKATSKILGRDAPGVPVLRKEELADHLQESSVRRRLERVHRRIAERKC